MIPNILKLWPILKAVGRGLGWLKDPDEEKAFQLKLLELAQSRELAESEEFKDFLKATTPDADRVYVWANTWIAITRPAITWVVTGAIVLSFFVAGVSQRMIATVEAFNNPAGLLLLSIPLWWFIGRDIVKIFLARFGIAVNGTLSNGNGNGELKAPPALRPAALPEPAPEDPSKWDRVNEGLERLRELDREPE